MYNYTMMDLDEKQYRFVVWFSILQMVAYCGLVVFNQ